MPQAIFFPPDCEQAKSKKRQLYYRCESNHNVILTYQYTFWNVFPIERAEFIPNDNNVSGFSFSDNDSKIKHINKYKFLN